MKEPTYKKMYVETKADTDRLMEHYRKLCDERIEVKNAVRSMTERMMTFLMQQTPNNMYSIHQILRDVEALLGDLDFRSHD
jgi:hypothetical protein